MEILFGEIDPYDNPELLIPFMEEYVKEVDNDINKEYNANRLSQKFKDFWPERICTYKEYQYLFTEIPEIEYRKYRAFNFLQIVTEHDRVIATTGYTIEKDSYASFVQNNESDRLRLFFSRHKQKLRHVMPYHDMKKHTFIPASSGSGKSTFINSKVVQMMEDYKAGIIVIDPHGELVDNIRKWHNIDKTRVIYFDVEFKEGRTPVFNPFRTKDRDPKNINALAQQMTNVFAQITQTDVTGNMKIILMPCIYTLFMKGDANFSDLQIFMDDTRNKHLIELGKKSPNEDFRHFFKSFHDPKHNASKAALHLKVQSLIHFEEFKLATSGESRFDLEQAMNENKIILFNLAGFEEEGLYVFGRLLVAQIFRIARKRRKLPPERRPTTFEIIDEFETFVSPSATKTLNQARKWGLHMILATQNISQLHDMKDPVLGNTAIKIVGLNDSKETVGIMHEILGVTDTQLRSLKKFEFYSKTSGGTAVKFKSNANYVNDDMYKMSSEKQAEFDKYQLDNYYNKVNPESHKRDDEDVGLNKEDL